MNGPQNVIALPHDEEDTGAIIHLVQNFLPIPLGVFQRQWGEEPDGRPIVDDVLEKPRERGHELLRDFPCNFFYTHLNAPAS